MKPWKPTVVSLIFMGGLTALPAEASTPPAAAELLAKYTQALDSLRSVIIKYEVTEEYEIGFDKNWVDPALRGIQDKGTVFRRGELRADGERFHRQEYSWGRIGPRDVPKERPHYNSSNWDNKQWYTRCRMASWSHRKRRRSLKDGQHRQAGLCCLAGREEDESWKRCMVTYAGTHDTAVFDKVTGRRYVTGESSTAEPPANSQP